MRYASHNIMSKVMCLTLSSPDVKNLQKMTHIFTGRNTA